MKTGHQQDAILSRIRKAYDNSTLSIYLIMQGDKLAGKVIVKHPKDGAGRLEVLATRWLPLDTMIYTNTSTGYGYDKVQEALTGCDLFGFSIKNHAQDGNRLTWDRQIEEAGFNVIQAL